MDHGWYGNLRVAIKDYGVVYAITPTENFKANSTHYNGTKGSSVVIFNETLNRDALFITGGASKVSHFNHYSKHS